MIGGIVHLEAGQNCTQLVIKLMLRIYTKLTIIMDIRVKGLNIYLVGRVVGDIIHIAVKLKLMINIDKFSA